MKKFESVIKFRCHCGEVMEMPFPAFDMKEMLEKTNAEAYKNKQDDIVCPKCNKYFQAEITANVYVGLDQVGEGG